MKLPAVLLIKGTSPRIAPVLKGQGGNALFMRLLSGVPNSLYTFLQTLLPQQVGSKLTFAILGSSLKAE